MTVDIKSSRVALVHDFLTQWGGGERVLLEFHRMFPEAPIYTLIADEEVLPVEMRGADIRPSRAQRKFKRGKSPLSYVPYLPSAADALMIRGYELVVVSSSSFAHGVRTDARYRIDYIHNAMRFAWDYDEYIRDYPVAKVWKPAGKVAAGYLKWWDKSRASRSGRVVANSSTVQRRIRERWGLHAEVIFPPADLSACRVSNERKTHFVVAARLVPYKRVDVAVEAANRTGLPMVVLGDGPDRARLEKLAGPTVQILGWVPEDVKYQLIKTAFAVVVPGVEDYGLVPVEANACGVPVVAYRRGGVIDTQVDMFTSLLVYEQTPQAFARALVAACSVKWEPREIAQHATRFSDAEFRRKFEETLGRWQ